MQLETNRLLLKEPTKDDLVELSKLWQNVQARKFLGGTIPEKEIQKKISELSDYWGKYGFGMYAVFLKPDLKIIGLCGFRDSGNEPDVELGYIFFPEFWGRGLATEAVLACLNEGFNKLNFKRIVAITQAANQASCHLLEKVGMTHARDLYLFNERQRFYEKLSFIKEKRR